MCNTVKIWHFYSQRWRSKWAVAMFWIFKARWRIIGETFKSLFNWSSPWRVFTLSFTISNTALLILQKFHMFWLLWGVLNNPVWRGLFAFCVMQSLFLLTTICFNQVMLWINDQKATPETCIHVHILLWRAFYRLCDSIKTFVLICI